MLIELLKQGGKELYLSDSRCENRESVAADLKKYKPTHVLNSAGKTGVPNVDWCEGNQEEALRSNVLGAMTVSDLCQELGIHHTLFATGCIFEYDAAHPIGGKTFTEEDRANFDGSFYSKTKVRWSHRTCFTMNYPLFIANYPLTSCATFPFNAS